MFTILENFRETILFILLGNKASSLKFEFICRKIGLVLFAMELDTHELFRCMTATTVMKFKSGLHYTSFKAQKLLEISEVFWSFTCISKSILCTQSGLTKSEGRNIKLRCYRKSQKSNSGTSNVFNKKKKPWLETPMTRNSTAIMPMDIHKQAIGKQNCHQVEFERQAVRTKATRSALRLCLHTVDQTFIYRNFLLLWIWQI